MDKTIRQEIVLEHSIEDEILEKVAVSLGDASELTLGETCGDNFENFGSRYKKLFG